MLERAAVVDFKVLKTHQYFRPYICRRAVRRRRLRGSGLYTGG